MRLLASNAAAWGHGQVLAFAAIAPLPQTTSAPESTPAERLVSRCDQLLSDLEIPADEHIAPCAVYFRCAQPFFARWWFPGNANSNEQIAATVDEICARFACELLASAQECATAAGACEILPASIDAAAAKLLPYRTDADGNVTFFPALDPSERIWAYAADIGAYELTLKGWYALRAAAASHDVAESLRLEVAEPAASATAKLLAKEGLVIHRLAGELARKTYAQSLAPMNFRAAAELLLRRREQVAPPAATAAESPPTFFADLREQSGITFRHCSSAWYDRYLRERVQQPTEADGGVAAEDIDGDGWPDLLFMGGGGVSYWRNRRDGTFEDRTAESGLAVAGEARMALVVDLDNDGRREIFVTYARDPARLFRQRENGTWEDVSQESGLQRPGDIAQATCAFDADGDGLLDLYVGNSGDWWNGVAPTAPKGSRNGQRNRLFHNLGGLHFEDVTDRSGTGDTGWCLAVASADADGDGDADLFVVNDFGPNELLLNNGSLSFTAAGARSHFDDAGHGMNVAFTDLNRDDLPDVYVTNIYTLDPGQKFAREWNRLLLSSGRGSPIYRPVQDELFRAQDTGWAWAALFFDADNDGDDDLYCVNGLTGYTVYRYARSVPGHPGLGYFTPYDCEPNCFWLNEGGRFVDASRESGATLADVNSRGLALLDFDRDGDLDAAVSTYHDRPRLLRNDLANRAANHWLVVRLIGDPARKVNRDAVGARILATAEGDLRVWRLVTAGEGFLGSSTLEVEIGLGKAATADLEIRWPNGDVQRLVSVAADAFLTVKQGEPNVVIEKR